MNNFFRDFVLGQYDPVERKISYDYGSLLWKGWKSTFMHERVHSVLSKETNHGLFSSVFFYIKEKNMFTKISEKETDYFAKKLKESQEYVQEGFATFFSLITLKNEGGNQAVTQKLKQLPNKPYGEAYAVIDFLFDWDQETRDKFTSKISNCAMNTSVPYIFNSPSLVLDHKFIEQYFSDPDNVPNKRLEMLASAVYKNKKLLDDDPKEICKAAGISFNPYVDFKTRAQIANVLLELTGETKRFTEETVFDPNKPSETEEYLEKVTIMSLNLGIRGAKAVFGLSELKALKMAKPDLVFLFYEHDQVKTYKEFYEKSKDKDTSVILFYRNGEKVIAWLSLEEIKSLNPGNGSGITLVSDMNLLKNLKPKKGYDFLLPNIIILRTFLEVRSFIDSLAGIHKPFYYVSTAPTKNHPFVTYLFRIVGENTIFWYTGLPPHMAKIKDLLTSHSLRKAKGGFTKIVSTNNNHFSNMMKYFLNTDPRLDFYEFARDAFGYYPFLYKKVSGRTFTGSLPIK